MTIYLDRNHFNYLVRKYAGDKKLKHFTYWNQLLTLMFGQLSNRESMHDLIIAIKTHHQKRYHLGLGKHMTRSNLSQANPHRDYRILVELHTTLSVKQDAKELQISSSLTVFMFSIPRQSRYVCMCFVEK